MKHCLIVLLFLFTGLVHGAEDKLPPLKIAALTWAAPYSFIDKEGEPRGLLIDYWRLWAKKVDRDIVFVPLTWEESFVALKNNEIDIHLGLFQLQQQRSYASLELQIFDTKSHLYHRLADRALFKTISDYRGKIIGVIDQSLMGSYLTKLDPDIEIKKYGTIHQLVTALERKQIDGFVHETISAWHKLVNELKFNAIIKLDNFEINNPIFGALSHTGNTTKEILQQGVANITNAEVIELEKKWIINPQLRFLSLKHTKQKTKQNILTASEHRWLLANPIVQIGSVENWTPFIYTDKNGSKAGFNIDLINIINKNLNTHFSIKYYSLWSDALLDVIKGELGGIFTLSWTKERAKHIDFSPIYSYSTHDIIVRKDEKTIASLDDLAGKRVAAFEHHVMTEIIQKDVPNAEVIFVKSRAQAYQLIATGVADAAIFSYPDHFALAESNLKMVNSIFTKAGELSIGTTNKHPMIGKIITKGINSITPAQKEALHNKWQNNSEFHSIFTVEEQQYIANNPIVTVGVEPWAPIIYGDNNGNIHGIVGDILNHVAKVSGLSFKSKKMNWLQQLEQFKRQKIDLLPITYFTEQRKEFGLFGEQYFDLASSIFVKQSNRTINNMDDLKGLKLAMIAGVATIDKIKQKFPEIIIVETKNTKDSVAQLLNGQVDATINVDVVMSNILNNGLIQGIKSIRQTEINSEPLHFFSHPDRPMLHSILNKSLRSISKLELEQMVAKWIGNSPIKTKRDKQALKVGFGTGRAPYTLNQLKLKGIEYDLTRRILGMSAIDINSVVNLPISELESALYEKPDLDMVVTVRAKTDRFFYSNTFISFNNVAISLKADNLIINTIGDLKDKSIMAFDLAYQHLGPEYYSLFNPDVRNDSYQTVVFQQQQFNQLLIGKVDVVIIDELIFKWFAAQAGYPNLVPFQIHSIFPKPNDLVVGFKNKNLRNLFNKNLAILHSNGEYQHILGDYAKGLIEKKNEMSFLMAVVSGIYFGEENSEQLKKVLDLFSSLPYIDRVEAFDNDQKLLSSSGNTNIPFFNAADSMILLSGIASKIGHINVYYNDGEVEKQLHLGGLIPDVSIYENLTEYHKILGIYRRFDYLEPSIKFSTLEQNYLNTRPVLRFAAANWLPLAVVDDGKFSGLFADYMNIVADKAGIKFQFQSVAKWQDMLTDFDQHQLDIIINGTAFTDNTTTGVATNEYANFHLAVVMAGNSSFVDNINDLQGKTIALPTGYTSYQYVIANYPDALIIETTDEIEALTLVRSGKADAFVGHLAVAAYRLEHQFSELKIAGLLDYKLSHQMLVKRDNPILLSIINKVIAAIPLKQHQEIRSRWLKRKIATQVDYGLLYRLVAVFCVILLVIFIVFNKLSRNKKQIEQTNVELEQSIIELNKTHAKLAQSEKMASLGGLVAGISHEINTPVGIGLTAITHFLEITRQLEEKYNNKKMSQKDFDGYLAASIESANIINRNLERTADLVRSFKQISVDQSSDERRSFNVSQYLEEILLSIHHITKKSQVDIRVQCPLDLVIESYPGAISQIISNLLINSTIHGYPNNEPGKIAIVIEKLVQGISINYQDDGRGIAPKHLPKIFEPFFTTNREHGGSGLGLNIIYNIVTNRLNGTIVCNSTLGQGVEFIIQFQAQKWGDSELQER